MCEDHYLPNEFNYIIYQASSGGISCPESDARIAYYAITGYPTLKFDGNWDTQVGAAEDHVNGQLYMSIIDDHRLTEAPLAVIVDLERHQAAQKWLAARDDGSFLEVAGRYAVWFSWSP